MLTVSTFTFLLNKILYSAQYQPEAESETSAGATRWNWTEDLLETVILRRQQNVTTNKHKSSAYILPLIVRVYLHSYFSGGLRKSFKFLQEWRFSRSRSSKVIGFGTNRKHVCNFLLVRHSNLGPILHRFSDIAGFLLMTPPLFHPILGGIPVGPDRGRWGQTEHIP